MRGPPLEAPLDRPALTPAAQSIEQDSCVSPPDALAHVRLDWTGLVRYGVVWYCTPGVCLSVRPSCRQACSARVPDDGLLNKPVAGSLLSNCRHCRRNCTKKGLIHPSATCPQIDERVVGRDTPPAELKATTPAGLLPSEKSRLRHQDLTHTGF